MNSKEAQRVIECLRKGIPPEGFVATFTVGRENEIESLRSRLAVGQGQALLLKANYGCGKSHLLQFVRETALEMNYAVSTITVDSRSGVRFNRMDQIMAAIWRGIEVPEYAGETGPDRFMDFLAISERNGEQQTAWSQVTNGGSWDEPQRLGSICLFSALFLWCRGKQQDEIADWLQFPWSHNPKEIGQSVRKRIPTVKAADLSFQREKYSESWKAIAAIHTLAKVAGLRGLVLLFDEFEDVFNLNNIDREIDALDNLFAFYGGKVFAGQSYFAVTPDFEAKCRHMYLRRGYWNVDVSNFDKLPIFSMSPLQETELQCLAERILHAHGLAYAWNPVVCLTEAEIGRAVKAAAAFPAQDRARYVVKMIVRLLDDTVEDGT